MVPSLPMDWCCFHGRYKGAAGGPVQVSKRAPLRRSSVLAQHGGFFTATWRRGHLCGEVQQKGEIRDAVFWENSNNWSNWSSYSDDEIFTPEKLEWFRSETIHMDTSHHFYIISLETMGCPYSLQGHSLNLRTQDWNWNGDFDQQTRRLQEFANNNVYPLVN